ncbi:hypothetical protein [Candidatus Mycoplasma haematominutum]|uniref:Lipoprotein n=1 Tax=Candidatus Mycoplasma haematominutum 'Birmingham 1' TaxID=1116213 RepID=G8C3Q6_9MOLU|nr:hypothetical protein [Candidatus Mycoplasma haematominutum]CCE66954.1 hypothetical protein MHM_04360 [Candidatus Mycoplasma haematominutum 'Birmingham 1']
MAVPLRSILGGVSLLGGSCAVATPIAMSVTAGGVSSLPKISLVKCENTDAANLGEVSYGEAELRNVCWKEVDAATQASSATGSEYTTLFQNHWGQGTQNWEVGAEQERWTAQCMIDDSLSNKWAIVVGTDTLTQINKYLRLCNSSSYDKTVYLKKEDMVSGSNSTLKFSICTSDCWEDPQESSGVKILTTEKSGSWKEVKFYNRDQTSAQELAS